MLLYMYNSVTVDAGSNPITSNQREREWRGCREYHRPTPQLQGDIFMYTPSSINT